MLSENTRTAIDKTKSTSFAIDLKKLLDIMETYENGDHPYHSTLPTDKTVKFHAAMKETEAFGFDKVKQVQKELDFKVRTLFNKKHSLSVASEEFETPSVMVYYTNDIDINLDNKFAALSMQIAVGVPLQYDEPDGYIAFRIGIFGFNKLKNINP